MSLVVRAPLPGTVHPLTEVPDPVFAEAMMGPGAAVLPASAAVTVVAPVAGRVAALHPHAFVLQSGERAVLVHLGVDTVGLDDAGTTPLVGPGDDVSAGQPVLRWDTAPARAGGLSVLCPVVAVQAPVDAVALLVTPGEAVATGDPLLRWS